MIKVKKLKKPNTHYENFSCLDIMVPALRIMLANCADHAFPFPLGMATSTPLSNRWVYIGSSIQCD